MAEDRSHYPRTLRATVAHYLRARQVRLFLAASAFAGLVRLGLGPATRGDGFVLLGLVAWWPVQEWLIHVHILHLRPFRIGARTVDPHVSRKHRRHHRDPFALENVFIPWPEAVGGVLFHYAVWPLVMPTAATAFTMIAAYLALTAHYEWVHFLCHTPYVPRSRVYKRLWRSHRLHHFKNEHYWMGVSMLAGDRLLGTSPDPAKVFISILLRRRNMIEL